MKERGRNRTWGRRNRKPETGNRKVRGVIIFRGNRLGVPQLIRDFELSGLRFPVSGFGTPVSS
jgi:hypothetical protein